MAYTLTLLGTDTHFLPDDNDAAHDAGYAKAETLSYISSLIKGKEPYQYEGNNKVDKNKSTLSNYRYKETAPIVKYKNQNVAVVDGPTTLGAEAGERIAHGVKSILQAVARGETQINIMAHSRGAVEAIMIAHELQRIKECCNYGKKTLEAWSASVDTQKSTGVYLKKHLKNIPFDKVADTISDLKLSILNIDPVPGGSYMLIGGLVAWTDKRMYELPAIVKEYEQYIYENERTCCFKPIVPKASTETKLFKITSIPGHHGTGSGNLSAQSKKFKLPKGSNTSHAQELMLINAVDFLRRADVELEKRNPANDPFAALTAQLLVENKKQYQKNRDDLYIDVYNNLIKNKKYYDFFNETSYDVLGREWDKIDRIIHYESSANSYLKDKVTRFNDGPYFNYEHAELALKKGLDISEDLTLSQLITKVIEIIPEVCKAEKNFPLIELVKSWEHIPGDNGSENKPAIEPVSEIAKNIHQLLQKEDGQRLFQANLDSLITKVTEKFLQDDFESEVEKNNVYHAVEKAFNTLNNYLNSPVDANNEDEEKRAREIASNIVDKFNSSLESALKTKQTSLSQEFTSISKKISGERQFLEDGSKRLQTTIENLERQDGLTDKDNNKEVVIHILNILIKESWPVYYSESIENVQKDLKDIHESIARMELDNKEYPYISQALAVICEVLEDSQNYTAESIHKEGEQLIHAFNKFDYDIDNLAHFNKAMNVESLKIPVLGEPGYLKQLLNKFRSKIKNNNEIINDSENIVLQQQISDLQAEKQSIDDLNAQLNQQQAVNQELQQQIDSRNEQQAVYQGQIDSLNAQLIQQLASNKEFQQKIDSRDEQQAVYQGQIDNLNAQLGQQNAVIDNLNAQLGQQNAVIDNLNAQLGQQNVAIDNLNAQLVQQNAANQVPQQQAANHQPWEFDGAQQMSSALIEGKLKPQTKEYLIHLLNKRDIRPDKNISNVDLLGLVPQVLEESILDNKIRAVSNLFDILNRPTRPTETVEHFFTTLAAANETITRDRDFVNIRGTDIAWRRYTAGIMKSLPVVLAVVLTGIIPGLVVLGIAAAMGKTPKVFDTKGQRFFDKVGPLNPEAAPELPPNNDDHGPLQN